MKITPRTQPLSLRTYGNESTPDPIAEAHRAKILPLSDPFSNFPKARLAKFLLSTLGEKILSPCLMLISPVAKAFVFGVIGV